MKPRSLRIKLTLWFTFIFTLIIFVSDYVTYRALAGVVVSELDSNLISMAAVESSSLINKSPISADTIVEQAHRYPQFVPQFVRIIDSEGHLIGSSGTPQAGAVLNPDQIGDVIRGDVITDDRWIDGKAYRIGAVSEQKDGQRFAVIVGARTEGLRHTTGRIAMILILVDVATILLSVAGGYVIIGKALRPVDHITERAHQIGAGDLHQRLQHVDSSLEMERLTSVLNEMFDKLQRLFESQKQFIQDASHEIRSPLAAIRCRLEVALRQKRTADDYRQVIESSLQDVERLTSLSEGLFLLARADSDNLSMEFREVSVSEVLAGIHEQLLPLAESRHIEFTIDRQAPGLVYADRDSLTQAFRNLVENALKYTPERGRVSIRVRLEGTMVRADVEDTGIGIPVQEQANIFKRFYRVDHARSRREGGTGLGLAICDQIIRAHQGRIEVESSPGHGSRFTVFLASAAALLDEATV